MVFISANFFLDNARVFNIDLCCVAKKIKAQFYGFINYKLISLKS